MVFMRRRQQRLRTTNVHNNPVRAFIMLLAQEVSKSHKPLLTVPQKGVPCQTYWVYLSIRVSHLVKGSHNQMGGLAGFHYGN